MPTCDYNATMLHLRYRIASLCCSPVTLAWLVTGRQRFFGETPLWAFAVEYITQEQ